MRLERPRNNARGTRPIIKAAADPDLQLVVHCFRIVIRRMPRGLVFLVSFQDVWIKNVEVVIKVFWNFRVRLTKQKKNNKRLS